MSLHPDRGLGRVFLRFQWALFALIIPPLRLQCNNKWQQMEEIHCPFDEESGKLEVCRTTTPRVLTWCCCFEGVAKESELISTCFLRVVLGVPLLFPHLAHQKLAAVHKDPAEHLVFL